MSSSETNICSDNPVPLVDATNKSSQENLSQSCWQAMELNSSSSSKLSSDNASFLDFDNVDLYASSQVCKVSSRDIGTKGGHGLKDASSEQTLGKDVAENAGNGPSKTASTDSANCEPRQEQPLSIWHPIDSAVEIYHRVFDEDCPDSGSDAKDSQPVNAKADSDKPADIKTLLTSPGSEYRGETIKEDMQVWPYTVSISEETSKLETVEEVARNSLGDQSPENIAKYAAEIRHVNNMAPDSTLTENQRLILPGHKPDGSIILSNPDDESVTRTVSPDGKMHVEFKGGRPLDFEPLPEGGFKVKGTGSKPEDKFEIERKPDGTGGYVETHKGSKPDDNYQITRTADGKYLIDENGKQVDKTKFDEAHPDPRVERVRLLDTADSKISDPAERGRLYEDVANFERRARKESISGSEQANFYHQVGRLLEPTQASANLPSAAERLQAAEQLVHHAANPSTVDQGNHKTCSAASLESTLLRTDPSVVASTVSDVALSGKFMTTEGDIVRVHDSLLKPDAEARIYPPVDDKRDFASQLFQAAAITSEVPTFRQVTPRDGDDTGEREVRNDRTVDFSGLTPTELVSMSKKIAGDQADVKVVQNARENSSDQNIHVNSEKELHNQLSELKKNGKLPAILFVDTRNEPFWTDSRAGLAGGSGSLHYVTVTDFNEKTGKASIDNQWGARTDHKELSVRSLYLATEPTGTDQHYDLLKQTVAQNRKEGKVDYPLELQLLRERQSKHELTDEKFEQELTKIKMQISKKEFNIKHKTPVQEDEFSRIHWAAFMMEKKLPQALQERSDKRVSEYNQRLRGT